MPDENPMLDQELDQPATRRDLVALEPRFDAIDSRFDQIDRRFDELRRHFDVISEQFRSDFKNLFDWTQTTTSSMGGQLDRIEREYGGRLTTVEMRLTKLEER